MEIRPLFVLNVAFFQCNPVSISHQSSTRICPITLGYFLTQRRLKVSRKSRNLWVATLSTQYIFFLGNALPPKLTRSPWKSWFFGKKSMLSGGQVRPIFQGVTVAVSYFREGRLRFVSVQGRQVGSYLDHHVSEQSTINHHQLNDQDTHYSRNSHIQEVKTVFFFHPQSK